jgi:hypothetical protein
VCFIHLTFNNIIILSKCVCSSSFIPSFLDRSLCCYLTIVFFFYLFNRHHNWSSLYYQAQILLSSHTHTHIHVVLLQPMVLIASTKFTRRLSRSFFFPSACCPLSRHIDIRRMDNGGNIHYSRLMTRYNFSSCRSFLIGIIYEIVLRIF